MPACEMTDRQRKWVVVGEIAGVYGVRGWLRIRSFTDPIDNMLAYRPWFIGSDGDWSECRLEEARAHGPGLVAKIAGVDDREAAAGLKGREIAVQRKQLPESDGSLYWTDLEGLEVKTTDGVVLGRVDYLIETGANDVLVVQGERERLIPFVREKVVVEVDLAARCMTVDWDPEF